MHVAGNIPAHTYGFNYNDKHSGRDFDMWLVNSPIDFLAESIDSLEARPFTHGVHDFSASFGSRPIQFQLVIRANSEKKLREKRREIAAWLSPIRGLKELWWDTEPDKYYMARRYGAAVDITQQIRQGFFTLSMVAPDPFAYERDERPIVINGGTHPVENKGTMEAEPSFCFTGTNTDGRIYISYASGTFGFNGELAEGESIHVDVRKLTVFKEDRQGRRTNVLNETNDEFPILPVGYHTITIETDDFQLTNLVFHPLSRWE